MTIVDFDRVALPGFLLLGLVVIGVLPARRVWRQTGVWAIVTHKPSHPLQRWAAGWLVGCVINLIADGLTAF